MITPLIKAPFPLSFFPCCLSFFKLHHVQPHSRRKTFTLSSQTCLHLPASFWKSLENKAYALRLFLHLLLGFPKKKFELACTGHIPTLFHGPVTPQDKHALACAHLLCSWLSRLGDILAASQQKEDAKEAWGGLLNEKQEVGAQVVARKQGVLRNGNYNIMTAQATHQHQPRKIMVGVKRERWTEDLVKERWLSMCPPPFLGTCYSKPPNLCH